MGRRSKQLIQEREVFSIVSRIEKGYSWPVGHHQGFIPLHQNAGFPRSSERMEQNPQKQNK